MRIRAPRRSVPFAATLIGFALGGFADGIVMHQILQWHHVLSLAPGAGDLRWQIAWDGVFHAAMYLVAIAGLALLWRAFRRREAPSGRSMAAALLIGFGGWHALDAVLSHWILGIHRIRLDSASPLLWDLAVFAPFGLGAIAAGAMLARRGDAGPGTPSRPRAAALLAAVTIGAGLLAMKPPPEQPFAVVAFRPGLQAPEVFAALHAVEARLLWADGAMGVVVVQLTPERRWALYGHGAIMVGGAGPIAGCAGWSRV
jgi:uncharacterized membrane protein